MRKQKKHSLFTARLFSGRLKKLAVLCACVVGQTVAAQTVPVREYPVVINDTTTYTLKLAVDPQNRPDYFYCHVFTPVCLTGECKPVYINLYWDLLGNYTRFDFPAGEELTRMDHKPFKPEDYDKLQTILSNTQSLLKDVSMSDLVSKGTENLADSVDAKAGATLKTVKNEVIDGAVYTCYTLWHIAHGKVVLTMRQVTASMSDDDQLHRFLASSNYHYQYWAMDKVIGTDGTVRPAFSEDLLRILRGKNIFTARYALQHLNTSFWASADRQRWLWETYRQAPYTLQIAMLKYLPALTPTPWLITQAARQLAQVNPEQTALLVTLLERQPTLTDETQLIVADFLPRVPDTKTAMRVYDLLHAKKPANRLVRQRLADYARTLNQTR
ncbi:hypothetical protein [Arsenicibacter rosenii]|uniref:Uncharacterized protein n=1 Tax=Arsenicibacter rosenii TaxID=1750698 RepID=A0A1S2VHE4_9BACT|nr:hypothetical protein [Arsenicibacter rosenii]OIN58171.1 hypothetical protein BLX24_16775 [Arsenicibacter rosenii]